MPLSIGRHGNSDFWRNDLFFPHLNPSSGNKTFGAIRIAGARKSAVAILKTSCHAQKQPE
jgi:hypothetical protein